MENNTDMVYKNDNTCENTNDTSQPLNTLELLESLTNFKNIMDLPTEERTTKLNVLTPLTDNLDKKIGDYLFISKEMVWLIYELKTYNLKKAEIKKEKKKNKSDKEKCEINNTNDY